MSAVDQTMEYRRDHLGGSDMAAILGVSQRNKEGVPLKTRLDVFLEKTGQAEPQEETEGMFWGKDLEDRICRRWAVRNNKKIRRRNQRIIHLLPSGIEERHAARAADDLVGKEDTHTVQIIRERDRQTTALSHLIRKGSSAVAICLTDEVAPIAARKRSSALRSDIRTSEVEIDRTIGQLPDCRCRHPDPCDQDNTTDTTTTNRSCHRIATSFVVPNLRRLIAGAESSRHSAGDSSR